jgi:hypothetical protein
VKIKEKLQDKIKNTEDNRKLNLSDTTIQSYVNNLIRLNNNNEPKSLKFLNNINSIKKKLEDYKPKTKKTYIASILSVLRLFNEDNKIIKKYEDYLKDIIKQTDDEDNKNKKSETQKDNWLEWADVESIFNELKEDVFKNKSKKKLNKQEYKKLLELVILGLYVLNEPRRNMDYVEMDVINKYDIDKHFNTKNYLNTDKWEFIFNKYKYSRNKTADKVQQRIKIDDELKEIITYYLKRHPLKTKTDYKFLVYYDGNEFNNSSNITKILNKIFGKNIGSSMLRHIYLTYKFGDKIKEMNETAENMAHSVEQQKKYIKFD